MTTTTLTIMDSSAIYDFVMSCTETEWESVFKEDAPAHPTMVKILEQVSYATVIDDGEQIFRDGYEVGLKDGVELAQKGIKQVLRCLVYTEESENPVAFYFIDPEQTVLDKLQRAWAARSAIEPS